MICLSNYLTIQIGRKFIITNEEKDLIRLCHQDINYRVYNNNLIPILMLSKDNHWIEFIRVVNIHFDVDVGIAIRYDVKTKRLTISGIHLNKQPILNNHQLLYPDHECRCLEDFICNIDELEILKIWDLNSKGYNHCYFQISISMTKLVL